MGSASAVVDALSPDKPQKKNLTGFSRTMIFRIVQQVGYFMRDQDKIIEAVLAREQPGNLPKGVHQSRHISVTNKLFDMADRAPHDHCSFVLSVVLYHMVMRGLVSRVIFHRW